MNKFDKIKYTFSLCFFCVCFSQAQINSDIKRTHHWYFGDKAGLDFTSGNPTIDLNSQMYERETGSVISDTSGNLLFYTSGDTVWNKNHQIMPNGTGLINCFSASQGGIIVKKPNSSTLYYIFTNDCNENAGVSGVHYSVVDMSLNGGFGDVTTKNVLLFAPSSERLAAVYHCNEKDIWIMGQVRNSNSFCAYLISENGVSSVPVISSIGFLHNDNVCQCVGQLKFSPNGRKMAAVYATVPGIEELFDFDNNTGLLSNFISLPADTSEYGVSFSPDNTKLYIEASYFATKIFQYDLSSGIPSLIIASRSIILYMPPFTTNGIFGLELAPNGKIYGSNWMLDSLDVINNPNALGPACNYVHSAIGLQGRLCRENLPQFIESYFNPVINPANCITSIHNIDFENKLSIYPNPVNTTLNIQSNEKIICAEIYDILGVQCKPEMFITNNIYTIDMTNEPNGIYYIKLKINLTNTLNKTIIINHD